MESHLEAVARENYKKGRDVIVSDWARENGCRLGIARNRTGSIFRPNNKYWIQSRAKIIKGELPEGTGY